MASQPSQAQKTYSGQMESQLLAPCFVSQLRSNPLPPKESRVASIPLCFMVWNVSQSSIDVEHPVLEGRGQSQLPPDSFSSSQKVLLETHLNLRIEGTWGVPELVRRLGAWKCTLGNGIIYFPVRSVAMTGEVGTEVV